MSTRRLQSSSFLGVPLFWLGTLIYYPKRNYFGALGYVCSRAACMRKRVQLFRRIHSHDRLFCAWLPPTLMNASRSRLRGGFVASCGRL